MLAATDRTLLWNEPNSEGEVYQRTSEPGLDGLSYLPESNRVPPFVSRPTLSKIPRPPNAFIIFRSFFIKNRYVSANVEANPTTLSKIIGMTWRSLPEDEKVVWHAKARAAQEEHKRKFPEYAFQPLHTREKNGRQRSGEVERKHMRAKRRTREVERKDPKRCKKIADLLVTGKKKEELELEMQAFDSTHVPETVTRFRTPITVESFRPADETSACEFTNPLLPAGHQHDIRVNPPQQSDSFLICSTPHASNSSGDTPPLCSHANPILTPMLQTPPSFMSPDMSPIPTPTNHNATAYLTVNPSYNPDMIASSSGVNPHLSSHNAQNHHSLDVYSNHDEIYSPSLMSSDMLYPAGYDPEYLNPVDPSSYDIFSSFPDLCPPCDPVYNQRYLDQPYETESNISSMMNILTSFEGCNWEC